MATHAKVSLDAESIELGDLGRKVLLTGAVVGVLSMVGAIVFALIEKNGVARFFQSYLVAFAWFLSITLGALFFVTLQHLVRAGWSVVVRRGAEILASNVVLLAILSLVIVVPVIAGNSPLYLWTDAERVATDHLLHEKHAYLNPVFFTIRVVLYFGIWIFLSRFFLRRSAEQDQRGDVELTSKMEAISAPGMILFALSLTFAAFDFLMSVEPYWFSTIFGVYVFAGAVMGFFALISLLFMALQKGGRLTSSISVEHYHDLGKFLFAFVFFWAYIAFSQYMLIWYGNIPEETAWIIRRQTGNWVWLGLLLLFGHFALPFVGLMSRNVKRRRLTLGLWAVWLLAMHYADLYWLVMPAFLPDGWTFSAIDPLVFLGMGGLYLASTAWIAQGRALRPLHDPRLPESVAFENF